MQADRLDDGGGEVAHQHGHAAQFVHVVDVVHLADVVDRHEMAHVVQQRGGYQRRVGAGVLGELRALQCVVQRADRLAPRAPS